ncbi:MAG: tRNA (adenosine(37)-N6)-threonylcarbamoyltransferase complex dimerization subunit type 1 TsaB [Thermoleophilia bacterium]
MLAFDAATDVATVALARLDDRAVLGEGEARPIALLEQVDRLLAAAGAAPGDLAALALGVGPGRYTSIRLALATGRALALALDLPVAAVSTLDVLAAGAPGAVPVIDARRGELFAPGPGGPVCMPAAGLPVEPGVLLVGDGALRYRAELEARGATIPSDDDPRHRPRAALLAGLADGFGPAEAAEPLYLRAPDAERTRKAFPRA